jgi:hypothetical protein
MLDRHDKMQRLNRNICGIRRTQDRLAMVFVFVVFALLLTALLAHCEREPQPVIAKAPTAAEELAALEYIVSQILGEKL